MTLPFEVVCGGITCKSAALRFLLSRWSAVTLQSEQVAVTPLQSPAAAAVPIQGSLQLRTLQHPCLYMFQQLNMIWVRSHCLATTRVQWGTWKAGSLNLLWCLLHCIGSALTLPVDPSLSSGKITLPSLVDGDSGSGSGCPAK